MSLSPSQALPTEPRRVRRWWGLVLASIMLHVVALYWAEGNIGILSTRQSEPVFMQAALKSAEAPSAAPAPTPAKTPAPAKRRIRPKSPAPSATAEPSTGLSKQAPVEPTDADNSKNDVANAAPTETSTVGNAEDKTKPAYNTARYKVNPPPSAELEYKVEATKDGQTYYGAGKIKWQFDGNKYLIQGDVGLKILFAYLSYMTFSSQGDMDDFGITPLLYAEKRFKRSETNTHFTRDRNLIIFSASQVTYQRRGGEQDRASVLWQLAGIGRGDSEKFKPDTEIPVFVAGERDGDVWNVRVLGEEEIEVGIGKVRAWHLSRIPPKGSYDRKLDIWLAPAQNWYPIRIRHTEVNGDIIDMSVSEIKPPA